MPLHELELAQMSPPGQAIAEPALHAPDPSHALVVSMPFEHVAVPQAMPGGGYEHAPPVAPLVQPVAPHVPPVTQAEVQQFPMPVVPHVALEHWPLAVQAVPGARSEEHAMPFVQ